MVGALATSLLWKGRSGGAVLLPGEAQPAGDLDVEQALVAGLMGPRLVGAVGPRRAQDQLSSVAVAESCARSA